MIFEWINDFKHPRDESDGIIMMKMVTIRPTAKISSDQKLMNDESLVLLELLPLRCHLDQSALRFIRSFFFSREQPKQEEELVGTFFREFRVKPCQLKVNYRPNDIDMKALHNGSFIEVLNVFPLENMELTLRTVEIRNVCGWGAAFSHLNSHWLADVCDTQMYKFLTDAVPFHTITTLGGGIFNLVLLPLNHSQTSL